MTVRPHYAPEHSDALVPRFVFVYRIRIENTSERTAQLVTRHWRIHDPVGGDSRVDGEGVVGERPIIAPGDVHEYESFCVLQSPAGHMEGHYQFQLTSGESFKVNIPRFDLRVPTPDTTF